MSVCVICLTEALFKLVLMGVKRQMLSQEISCNHLTIWQPADCIKGHVPMFNKNSAVIVYEYVQMTSMLYVLSKCSPFTQKILEEFRSLGSKTNRRSEAIKACGLHPLCYCRLCFYSGSFNWLGHFFSI